MTTSIQTKTGKVKTPALVSIIGILTLIAGLGALLFAIPSLIVGTFFAIVTGLIGVVLVAAAYGLSNMKKWGLYLFTVAGLISIGQTIYVFVLSSEHNANDLLNLIIPVLVLVYLWSISKKFV